MIEGALKTVNRDVPEEVLKAIEDYAVECSIIKVAGSETLDYCSDEAVQVFGGNGYSKDYPVERAYRDARISRIYEGTNEINRLIMSGQILRRSAKGELPLFAAAKQLMDEMLTPSMPEEPGDEVFARERQSLANAKKALVAVLGLAAQKYRDKVQEQQEVLAAGSDIIMEIFGMESAILRTEKQIGIKGEESSEIHIAATRTFVSDSIQRVEQTAKTALAAMTEGDELRTMLAVLRRYMKATPYNTIEARRRIADSIIEAGRYNL
jgi:hypothetical protein